MYSAPDVFWPSRSYDAAAAEVRMSPARMPGNVDPIVSTRLVTETGSTDADGPLSWSMKKMTAGPAGATRVRSGQSAGFRTSHAKPDATSSVQLVAPG
jgi:hypothetical protein